MYGKDGVTDIEEEEIGTSSYDDIIKFNNEQIPQFAPGVRLILLVFGLNR